jgi:Mrp family chromosome partitioning ATPase
VLASNGKRVLVVDMHLDAPGVHRYFAPFLTDPDLTESQGVIEYVTDYVQASASLAGAVPDTWLRERANILRFAVSLEWEFGLGGTIDFVPAGRQGTSYQVLVNELNWELLYERLGGDAFFARTADRMRQEYDVLIDAPPGIGTVSASAPCSCRT